VPLPSTTLELEDVTIAVTRRAVRRATLRVHTADGRVTLSAPLRAPERDLVRFVREHLDWVRTERDRAIEEARREALLRPPPARARTGETWWWSGEPWRLEHREHPGRARVVVEPDHRLVVLAHAASTDDERLAVMERWQRRVLREAAVRRVDAWSDRLAVEPTFLGVRRMSTRWGSCVTTTGRVWLNLALVERPASALELVVVHELVHLITPHHGRRFVDLMDRHLPDWRERQRDLDGPWPPQASPSAEGT
jgi:predicted metal-dependent hydrolase